MTLKDKAQPLSDTSYTTLTKDDMDFLQNLLGGSRCPKDEKNELYATNYSFHGEPHISNRCSKSPRRACSNFE